MVIAEIQAQRLAFNMKGDYPVMPMDAKAEALRTSGDGGPASARLVALDLARGLVMLLMALDHSSGEFNRGRLMTDGAFMWHPGTPLPAAQFLTRWMSHICAPTFVFLAGTALALSTARRLSRGESHASIDLHLLLRGLFIASAELVPSFFWMRRGRYLFQVLYAIGVSFCFMIPLRRLPAGVLAVLAVGILACGEAVVRAAGWGPAASTPIWATLLLVPGSLGPITVGYPALYWLAIMILGFAFAGWLKPPSSAQRMRRRLVVSGTLLLALFAAVRGANGYGNMGILREGLSLVQWLHVSKYPPSVSFVALELGLASLVLALFFRIERPDTIPVFHPVLRVLLVFGRTPMFFYLLHIPLLAIFAEVLGVRGKLGLGAAYGFAAIAVAVLYPACKAYASYKAAHPAGIARYV